MTIRREFLASIGMAVVLAGCSSTPDENSSSTEPPTSLPTEERTTDSTPENGTVADTRETTQLQEAKTNLDVSIDQAEWVDKGVVVESIVSNRADVPTRSLELIVDWYDADGNFIDWDSKIVPALDTGKTWYLQIEPSTDRRIDDFEATARGIPLERDIPDGVEIRSRKIEDSGPQIVGILSNTRSSEVGVNVIATVYEEGWLTHAARVIQSRIPAGANWSFNIPLRVADANARPPGDEIELFVSTGL